VDRQALVRNGRSDNPFRIGYIAAPQLLAIGPFPCHLFFFHFCGRFVTDPEERPERPQRLICFLSEDEDDADEIARHNAAAVPLLMLLLLIDPILLLLLPVRVLLIRLSIRLISFPSVDPRVD